MHILIAPNAFKNSLNARQVADAIQQGLKLSKLNCTSACFPVADGGDGTGNLVIEMCEGEIVWKEVLDPLGRKIMASFGLIDSGKTAVIEMANASGLRLLNTDELNPMLASSFGTGELIRFALNKGVNKIVLAMGGSATVDGGCGILNAIGINFLDADGNSLSAIPRDLINLAKVDVSALDERIYACEFVILCDVDNMLLGEKGSAAIFGPQKGATPDLVKILDGFLKNLAEVSIAPTGINMANLQYGGTAGGAAAGLHAFLNARLVNGIQYFLSLTNFDEALNKADLVITGEGSIDQQTLSGKGPYGVAVAAKNKNIPVIGMAGSIPLEKDENLTRYFDLLVSINNEPVDLATAMRNTGENLIRTATAIGDLIAQAPNNYLK